MNIFKLFATKSIGKEVLYMARHWEDRERLKAGKGPMGFSAHVCWFLGVLFAVLGIVADVVNGSLGLESTSWFLLSIATFLAGLAFYIGWAVSWHLTETEAKGKKEG